MAGGLAGESWGREAARWMGVTRRGWGSVDSGRLPETAVWSAGKTMLVLHFVEKT